MKINWFKIDKKILLDNISKFLISDISNFSYILLFLKQGYRCKDCNKSYYYCECNYCYFCKKNTCICNIKEDKIEFIIKLSRLNLSLKNINIIINNIKRKDFFFVNDAKLKKRMINNMNIIMEKLNEN